MELMMNPLSKYFRQPGIQLLLPTKGNYSRNKFKTTFSTNEVNIFPMTAADDIMINTPDMLLNGTAVEELIKSCCPDVGEPRYVCYPDIDAIIMAIRMVSFGNNYDISIKCPKCNHMNELSYNIRGLLDTMTYLPDEYYVRLNDDLVAYLRPHEYESFIKARIVTFEQSKILQNLEDNNPNEELRIKTFAESSRKISKTNLDMLSSCIIKIVTPDGEVSDLPSIQEFISSCETSFVRKIKDGVAHLDKFGLSKELEAKCKSCEHVWNFPIQFDPSDFFANASS